MASEVLIAIPAYNEEKTVGEVVRSTLALYPDFKVIVVDDGSEDRTAQKAKEAGADVVSLPFHCGGPIAVQTGYLVAAWLECDYTVKIDADGQHKPEEVQKLLNPLIADEADVTIGSRYIEFEDNSSSMVKEGGRIFSSTLVSSLRNIAITDVTSGMRAWSLKAIETLLSIYEERGLGDDSVFWIVETLLASKKGLRLKEVPIKVLPRKHGKSKSFAVPKMLLYPARLLMTLIQEIRG